MNYVWLFWLGLFVELARRNYLPQMHSNRIRSLGVHTKAEAPKMGQRGIDRISRLLPSVGAWGKRKMVGALASTSYGPRLVPKLELPSDRDWGITIVAMVLLAPIRWWLSVIVPVVLVVTASMASKSALKRHTQKCELAVPLLVDLLRASLTMGIEPRAVFEVLGECSLPAGLEILSNEFGALSWSLRGGAQLVESLEPLEKAAPASRGLIEALASAHRLGVSIGPALALLSQDARALHRRDIEAQARKLPVLLLFPLVLCTLPAFAILAIAPLLLSGFSNLSL